MARFTVILLTPYVSQSSAVVGSFVPVGSAPFAMEERMS
jgi:hypothetical protein